MGFGELVALFLDGRLKLRQTTTTTTTNEPMADEPLIMVRQLSRAESAVRWLGYALDLFYLVHAVVLIWTMAKMDDEKSNACYAAINPLVTLVFIHHWAASGVFFARLYSNEANCCDLMFNAKCSCAVMSCMWFAASLFSTTTACENTDLLTCLKAFPLAILASLLVFASIAIVDVNSPCAEDI
jgi:hypothetical protein